MRFSLVIPAYNEQEYLPRLLKTVNAARERYRHGADSIEVIVADNCSTDNTASVAREYGCKVVSVEKRRIAAARNGGASAATGEWLAFVDADSQIDPETFNEIENRMNTGRYIGGASGVKMERWSVGIAATYLTFLPPVILMKMDTGVVFCRREDFQAIGGYDEQRYFGEDVALLFALRRLGKKKHQKLTRARKVKAIASTRKFDKHGEWHYFSQIFGLLRLMVQSPSATTDFAKKYWYEDR